QHRPAVGGGAHKFREDSWGAALKHWGKKKAKSYGGAKIDGTAEKDGAGGVYVVAAEIGPEFEVMPADRQTEVVDELKAPLRSIRRRPELPAEYADAGQPDARSERVHSVDVVSVAYELEAEFIRRPTVDNMRLAENDGVVSTTYIEA